MPGKERTDDPGQSREERNRELRLDPDLVAEGKPEVDAMKNAPEADTGGGKS